MNARPNILFILLDDLGWRDLSCYGSEFYETPNLDCLTRDGIRFTNAYASCPVCSPTRASVLSGKYPAKVGVTDWIDSAHELHPCRGRLIDAPYIEQLPLSEKSLASTLRDGGYQTWHVGKWHLGTRDFYPDRHGFDVNIGGCHWGMPYNGYFSPWGIPGLDDGPDGEYLTDCLTDQAIRLIREKGDKPFFLNLWHYAVHTPIQAPEQLVKKYEAKVRDMGLDGIQAIVEGELFPCEHLKGRVQRRVIQSDPAYAAMIENLDWNIGRLLDAFEETGLAENTIVIFTSDNGGCSTAGGSPTCNAPLAQGKGWMYEGGTRVPLIVRWPNVVEPGSVCDVPVASPDFYPTLLEAAELDLLPEQHSDGVSLIPLLKGTSAPDRDSIYWHYPHYGDQGGTPGSSLRCGDYKLIEFFEDNRLELYDLRHDPGEDNNLADSRREIARSLHEKLVAWRESVNARIPEPNH